MTKLLSIIALLGFCPFFIMSCTSDEQRIEEAKAIVTDFVNELNMENFNSMKLTYPGFGAIDRYNVLRNYTITSVNIKPKSDGDVNVIGTYGVGDFTKTVQFVVGTMDNGEKGIVKSKGLSSYYESSLYNALKRMGCLSDIESDVDIHRQCKARSAKFEQLVANYRNSIEKAIVFQKNGSSLKNNYGISISGEIMLKNTLNITIPGYAYDIYIMLYNKGGSVEHSRKYQFNNDPILAGQMHQITVYTLDYNYKFKSYSAVVRITNDDFIRNYIANSSTLTCADLN
jgi:hypothetical protein